MTKPPTNKSQFFNWKFWFATLILTFSMQSCLRYPEGPKLSFRSSTNRINFHNHRITRYVVNGQDSTLYLNELLQTGLSGFEGQFSVIQESYFLSGNIYWRDSILGTLVFVDEGKRSLYLSFNQHPNQSIKPYTITKLRKKELWFEKEENGRFVQYRIER